MPKSKMRIRRERGAVCFTCKSPDWIYEGRTWEPDGKHQFLCLSCGRGWQYGRTESVFLELI